MSFDRINRRTHLYLGLILLPWLTMYGLSSFVISHRPWFRADPQPGWEFLFERPCQQSIPTGASLRDVAHQILKENGLEGAFNVQRPKPNELRSTRTKFRKLVRLTYSIPEQKVRAERQHSPWDQSLVYMHFRGGYHQPLILNKLWGLFVDLTCVVIVIWIASGIIMWWRLERLRLWGALALGGGVLSFLLFVWAL
jgi:hypothetical protein